MAKKFNCKVRLSIDFLINFNESISSQVCPHAGGVGLSEMVQHLQFWDFASVSASKEGRIIEFVDQQHDQFVSPAVVINAKYIAPSSPGYNTELTSDCIEKFAYPAGSEWQRMFAENIYPRP